MEQTVGADLGSVTVHESPRAKALGALAYTQGTEVHFAPGQYRPDSSKGQELLGHELTHVVQQSRGPVSATTQVGGVAVNDDPALEREADRVGARAARGEGGPGAGPATPLAGTSTPVVQGRWARGGTPIDLDERERQIPPLEVLATLLPVYQPILRDLVQQLTAVGGEGVIANVNRDLQSAFTEEALVDLELLANFAVDALSEGLGQAPVEGMTGDGHTEDEGGDGPEYPIDPEDIDVAYWRATDLAWLYDLYKTWDVTAAIHSNFGPEVTDKVFEVWFNSGVMTRAAIWKLAEQIASERRVGTTQRKAEGAVQLKRGPGRTGPKSYPSSNLGPFANVAYDRDGDGYFDFAAPSLQKTWKDPRNGAVVDMETGGTKKGWGLMKDNKTKVQLKTASRSQHFSIANRITGQSGSGSPDGYTWHHLKEKYKMILIDRQVHAKHGHNGGIYLWNG